MTLSRLDYECKKTSRFVTQTRRQYKKFLFFKNNMSKKYIRELKLIENF